MRFAPYSNDHIIYILMYIYIYTYTYTYEQSFSHFLWNHHLMRLFFLSPTSLFDSFVAPPKQPAPLVLRLKCEDDHGTCHGQWFCEPCRLRLGRGSVSRMLLLPCTNKAITSKMKANYVCVELRHGLMCFFPASSILFDWFALSKFKQSDGQLKGSENCIIFVVKTLPFRCTCTTNTHTHWHMSQIYCCNCNIS